MLQQRRDDDQHFQDAVRQKMGRTIGRVGANPQMPVVGFTHANRQPMHPCGPPAVQRASQTQMSERGSFFRLLAILTEIQSVMWYKVSLLQDANSGNTHKLP